jgi:putative FmdB family regulatory protein
MSMPAYEYRCANCKSKVAIYQSFAEYGKVAPACPKCGSSDLTRLISRVRIARSEESRLETLSDPTAWGDVDENDPRSMAKMMRRMGGELGEDMGPEFNEAVDRMESGESPEEIEKSMPNPGGGSPGGSDDFED